MNNLEEYYKKRAFEYEKIYFRNDPIRLKEQHLIQWIIKNLFKDKIVLEIAAGTGYWTQFLSETAQRIVITDKSKEMLELAKKKCYYCEVEFRLEDAYDLSFDNNAFEAGIANFWLSHLPRKKIIDFINEFHRVLKTNSLVFFTDNVFVKGIGGKYIKPNGTGDSYKIRKLENGSKCLIIKNYLSKSEIFDFFQKYDDCLSNQNLFYGTHFWYIYYNLRFKCSQKNHSRNSGC